MHHMIFGESHGPVIGVTLSGVPAGLALDLDALQRQLDRRAPGKDATATARKESDVAHVVSGLFEGKTTGAPLTILIQNSDQHSSDYDAMRYTPRPSHGDYPGFISSKGCQDHRGGGHFSGRLTAPLVAAGAVARQVLAQQGISIAAHISIIDHVYDDAFTTWSNDGADCSVIAPPEVLEALAQKTFPVLNDDAGEQMRQRIMAAKADGDSVGGDIECAVVGLPVGLGAPDFGKNVEGIFAQHLFAIPAIRGVAFGNGFLSSTDRGSEANDPLIVRDGKIVTATNNAGGVNGGITNGMPLLFTVCVRPTPSIALPQKTVDLRTGEEVELVIKGRHDPCIVPRAVPVVEAAAALAACELLGV